MVRLTALINPFGADDMPKAVVERARRAEGEGFDILSYADFVTGDVFPALILAAQATERIGLMTRIVGAFNRSAVLIASGSAWVDRVGGGRFILGIGPSLRDAVEDRHGVEWRPAAAWMADTLTVIRQLWGEEMAGVSHNDDGSFHYSGKALTVRRAEVDLTPLGRPPIYVAAGGPLMLQAAGALADGVILEMTTPAYCRWAWTQIEKGAASVGRTLENFQMCIQGTYIHDEPGRCTQPSTVSSLAFYNNHLNEPAWQALWRVAGFADEAAEVQAHTRRGDTAAANQVILDRVFPRLAIYPSDQASFWRWYDGHLAAGVNIVALPLECRRILGVSVADCRARAEHMSGN